MVLGRFRWFSVICGFSSYCEIRCLKFEGSRQLWGGFVRSTGNDAKVPLKKMNKFLGSSTYKALLKKAWVGERSFVLWKLIFTALCKFPPFWFRFSPFCSNFFKDLLVWLIIGWQVRILEYLRIILIYWNLVVVIFSKFQSYLYERR